MDTEYTVNYEKVGDEVGIEHEAVFDNLEDAQLFWDTLLFLRNQYRLIATRP